MTKTSISERCAMRTGADRENLLLSETRTILRACSTMARDISTSRMSKSSKRAGLVDRRRPDHREINAKLLDLLNRDRPDNAAVALAHRSAGEEDFDGAVSMSSLATWRLLVMTRRPECLESAFATSSVVVPILMNSDELSGMSRAAASPINRFWSWATSCRAS